MSNTKALKLTVVRKCERRSENVARGGDRRAVRKRSAHGLAHGSEVTMGDFFSHPGL